MPAGKGSESGLKFDALVVAEEDATDFGDLGALAWAEHPVEGVEGVFRFESGDDRAFLVDQGKAVVEAGLIGVNDGDPVGARAVRP